MSNPPEQIILEMKKMYLIMILAIVAGIRSYGQVYSGKITDAETLGSLPEVEISIPEEGISTVSDSEGNL